MLFEKISFLLLMISQVVGGCVGIFANYNFEGERNNFFKKSPNKTFQIFKGWRKAFESRYSKH